VANQGGFKMNIFNRFLKSSLRFKIFFGLLLPLVPMLAIMAISLPVIVHWKTANG